MIKLMDLLVEVNQEQQLEEGWKENIMAAAIAASSIFGGVKGQTPITTKPGIEQSISKPGPLNVDFGAVFPSGRYLIKGSSQADLVKKLEEIGKYISKNPKADYTIEIISSESQVPNYDAEKPGRVKLNTGELAQKRAIVVNAAVKEFTDKLKAENVLQGNVNIKVAPVLIGDTEFKQGIDNKDDSKYTKDQFVKLNITATQSSTSNKIVSATDDEIILDGSRKAIAVIWYNTRLAKNDETGNLNIDPSKKYYTIKFLKPNTSTSGDIKEKGVYEDGTYLISAGDWNNKFGAQVYNMNKGDLMSMVKGYKID
jgi:hypothetical protein